METKRHHSDTQAATLAATIEVQYGRSRWGVARRIQAPDKIEAAVTVGPLQNNATRFFTKSSAHMAGFKSRH
jgi:hypothetical protein